jgi:predicted TIM-barrel fold metal-dependent hydrolase
VTATDLRSAFTEALDSRIALEHLPQTAVYRDAIGRLARELECEPTEEAVLEMRNRDDPAAYANRLMDQSGNGLLLLDHGFSPDAFTPEQHRAAIRLPQREVIRLETLAEGLIGDCADPRQWFATVREALRESVAAGTVAVKTIAAYRAGLRLRSADADELGVAFSELRTKAERGEMIRLTGAPLCHGLLLQAAAECRDLGVPLQVHCGFGDPDEDLAEASPLGLRMLFHDPRYQGLRIVLLHCYPFHREAAYLCSVYPDVFMDLSLALPIAGVDGAKAVREALGLCPWSKLLYATDASRLPEAYFVAAGVHRQALAEAFAELVEGGILTRHEAVEAGLLVLAGNAGRVYALEY